ncbi:MAG: hypothetical protein JWN17_2562, partial [Frankiales bacterium]|nr:hypothetical protein [Frankiales bacterium]
MSRDDTRSSTDLVRVPRRRATSSGTVLGAVALSVAVWAGLTAPSVSPVAAAPAVVALAAPAPAPAAVVVAVPVPVPAAALAVGAT